MSVRFWPCFLLELQWWSDFKERCPNAQLPKSQYVWFLHSSVTVNWISVGCGHRETCEDVILGSGKTLINTDHHSKWYFIDQRTNHWIETIINRFIEKFNWSLPLALLLMSHWLCCTFALAAVKLAGFHMPSPSPPISCQILAHLWRISVWITSLCHLIMLLGRGNKCM